MKRKKLFVPLLCFGLLAMVPHTRAELSPASALEQTPVFPVSGETIQLKEFLVEAEAPTPWTYVSIPGYEILSRCKHWKTEWEVDGLVRGMWYQRAMFPPGYCAELSVPGTMILYDQTPKSSSARSLVAAPMKFTSVNEMEFGKMAGRRGISPLAPVFDEDTASQCVNLESVTFQMSESEPVWSGVNLWLKIQRRTPPLPPWLVAGLLGPYGLYHDGVRPRRGGMAIGAAYWISSLGFPAALPPIADLFDETNGGKPSPLWLGEAALFVNWGMYGDSQGDNYRKAFTQFLNRAAAEPITEAMFRECFGFGYSEMQERLVKFAPYAEQNMIMVHLDSPNFPKLVLPDCTPRPASDDDVARILGDWERMEGESMRTQNPALAQAYFDQAGKTMMKAYNKGSREPRLLAALGLYQIAIGDKACARQFLEAAAKAKVVRPRAYLELARLRLEAIEAKPAGPEGKCTLDQTATVLDPLFVARDEKPALVETYLLIADAWSHCTVKPEPGNLAVLDEGRQFFPRATNLAYATAVLNAKWGYKAAAVSIVEQGLKFADAIYTERFKRLQLELGSN
jgi:hypothetical protein